MRNRMLKDPPLRVTVAAVCAFGTMYAAVNCGWLSGYSAVSLLSFAGLGILYHWALPLLEGRLARFALGGGAVFALCQAVGEVMEAVRPMRDIPFLFLLFLPLYVSLVCAGLTLLDRHEAQPKTLAPGRVRLFFTWLLSDEKKAGLALWGALLLCWLPYYLIFFPGSATSDTFHQISMAFTPEAMSSHHPPLHSWWIGKCMRLGMALFGTYGAGIALASAVQSLLMALLAAATLRYMFKLSIGFGWRMLALALYALSPLFAWYSVTLWKDIWLGCFGLLFLLCCADMVRQRADFFKDIGRLALLSLSVFGLLISKNNGVYIFAITAAALVIFLQGTRRQTAALLALGLLCSWLITGPLYSAMGVQKGSVREALSLPLLQLANVVRLAPDTVSAEDQALIRELLPYYDELGQRYDITTSDAVKEGFVDEAFTQKPGVYLGLYVRLGLQHPQLYLRAALEHTFGYYYCDYPFGWVPLTTYYSYLRDNPGTLADIDLAQDEYTDLFPGALEWVQLHIGNGTERLIPGLSMLFSAGLCFWMLLFCGLRVWYKKQHLRLLALAMPFALWLTCLASPVNGSVRYAFPAMFALPFLLGYMLDSRAQAEPCPIPCTDERGDVPCT